MRNRLIALGAVALFAVPVLLDFAMRGWNGVFRYFAADCFLYLTVARNFAEYGFFTIDQIHATNGFHPLWQVFLALLYCVGKVFGFREPTILTLVLLTNVVFIAAALALVCRSYALARGRVPVSFLFLPLGFFGLFMVPLATRFGPRGALWGFVNGMESSLSLLLYAALVLLMVRADFPRRTRSALIAGTLLAALLLARLDNAFLAVAVCGTIGLRAVFQRDRALFLCGVRVALPVLAVLAGYLAVNLETVGMALPVSGVAKYRAPNLALLNEIPNAFAERSPVRSWRLAQVIFPMLVAIAALACTWRSWLKERMDPLDWVFVTTAAFVLLLGLYCLLAVPLTDQGHWYFPISILFSSLFILNVLDRWRRLAFLESGTAAAAFAGVTVLVFYIYYAGSRELGPPLFSRFVTVTAPEAREHYGAERPRILSFDDGIVAYATGWPVMTGRGFMLDADSIESFRNPDLSLLELAYERGFDRITALFYLDPVGRLGPSSTDLAIRHQLRRQLAIRRVELERFRFRVDYLSSDRRFAVIKMERRE